MGALHNAINLLLFKGVLEAAVVAAVDCKLTKTRVNLLRDCLGIALSLPC